MEGPLDRAHRILAARRPRIDLALDRFLPAAGTVPRRVHEAMRYSTLAPGKRLRPVLALVAAEAVGGTEEDAIASACALEMIHAFSLIHDDLPAMDDDDLRRGRPTNHVQFGEATAILAGDALCSLAFEVVAAHTPRKERVPGLVTELARAVGTEGMIGGQILDLESEGRACDLEVVSEIHRRKTAALIRAACRLGAMAAGGAEPAVSAVSRYGEAIGLAFQIMDDVLDETSTPAELGKSTRKDHERGKLTYPACAGIADSRAKAASLVEEAVAAIRPYDRNAELEPLARFVALRTT